MADTLMKVSELVWVRVPSIVYDDSGEMADTLTQVNKFVWVRVPPIILEGERQIWLAAAYCKYVLSEV